MSHNQSGRQLSRRNLLRGGAAGLAASAAGIPLLAGCSSNSTTEQVSAGPAKVPKYIPFQGPKPDLAGNGKGVMPGYYSYPANPPRSVTKAPAHGGSTSAMLITFTPPPTPESKNADWKEIEKRIGSKLTLSLVAPGDYQAKLSTVMAGNSLPDLLMYTFYKPVPHLPQFLEAKCADLTPYVAGDAIKEWPNLANIPTQIWRNSAVSGKIFGIPTPTPLFANGFFYYQDMLDEVGGELPKNADDYFNLLKEMTNAKAGRWGFVGAGGEFAMSFCQQMWHVPNNWQADKNGRFTKDIETEENKEALAFNRKLYKAAVFYPGMRGFSNPQRKNTFNAGKAFMTTDGFTAFNAYWHDTVRENAKIRVMLPPGHNGGKGQTTQTPGYYSITLLKKGSKQRVQELLGIVNFFAAPFGTQEHLLLNYGVEGVDYTRDGGGNPVQNGRGKAELPTSDNPWPYFVGHGPSVITDTSSREYVQVAHQAVVDGMPLARTDPSFGLYSPTDSTKGTTIATTVSDAFTDIISGKRPMSDYDKVVREWRSSGGDQIRNEYQKAWKQAND